MRRRRVRQDRRPYFLPLIEKSTTGCAHVRAAGGIALSGRHIAVRPAVIPMLSANGAFAVRRLAPPQLPPIYDG
jgi:hypothetical protein